MKRPIGLKAKKQQQQEQQQQLEEPQAKKPKMSEVAKEEEEEMTLQVMEVGEGDEPAGEIEELEGLFDSALEQLNDNSLDQAKMLFRGVVHECDKMIRMRDAEQGEEAIQNATEEERIILKERLGSLESLNSSFYVVYANALYHLSLLEDYSTIMEAEEKNEAEEEVTANGAFAFLEEAQSRAELALELKDCAECLYVLTRILIQKAIISSKEGNELDMVMASFKKTVDAAKSVFSSTSEKKKREEVIAWLLELGHLSHTIGESFQTLKEKVAWWHTYNQKMWKEIGAADEGNVQALIGEGMGWLSLADESIQALHNGDAEEDEEEERLSEEEREKMPENIVSYLNKCISCLNSVVKSKQVLKGKEVASLLDQEDLELKTQVYLLLGEAHVHLGNILDKDEEEEEDSNTEDDSTTTTAKGRKDKDIQQKVKEEEAADTESLQAYRKAVQAFEVVMELDCNALPEQFQEFVDEWRSDFD